MKRADGPPSVVRTEKRIEFPLDVDSPDPDLMVEEILELLREGRSVEESRGFLRGIDTAVEREPDRL